MERDLKNVLERYPAQARPWDDPVPLGNAGGLSGSRFWRYSSGYGMLLAREWPVDGPPPTQLDRVHGWLRDASRLGFVPTPVAALDGRTYREENGRLWEITPWLHGSADSGRPPNADHVASAFLALAAFHQCLAVHRIVGPSPAVLLRLEELRGLIHGGLSRLDELLSPRGAEPIAAPAGEWVAMVRKHGHELIDRLSRASALQISRQPILRDARPEHFLFEGASVAGLVDFGAMGVDTVSADLARLVSEWLDPKDPLLLSEALSAYESLRPLSASEHTLFQVLLRSTLLLGPGRWVSWHLLEQKVFSDPEAIFRGLSRGMDRLNAARSVLFATSR